MKTHYPHITVLRIIACLGVFVGHLSQRLHLESLLGKAACNGTLCVEVFFVINGFLATSSFSGNDLSVHSCLHYLKTSAVRILLLYYFVILYFFITETYVFHSVPTDPSGLSWFRYCFLLAGCVTSNEGWFGFCTNLGITCSVFVFIGFYFLVPLFALLIKKYRHAVYFTIISWLLHVFVLWKSFPYFHVLYYMIYFLFGMLGWFALQEHRETSFTALPVGFTTIAFGDRKAGELVESEIEVDLPGILPGSYYIGAEFHEIDSSGANQWHDYIQNMLQIEILENRNVLPGGPADHTNKIPWNHNMWGSIRMPARLTDNTTKNA